MNEWLIFNVEVLNLCKQVRFEQFVLKLLMEIVIFILVNVDSCCRMVDDLFKNNDFVSFNFNVLGGSFVVVNVFFIQFFSMLLLNCNVEMFMVMCKFECFFFC